MDLTDATIALGLIGEYWPGRALSEQQLAVWAATVVRTGAEFDATCEAIAHAAEVDARPPTLAELCARIRRHRDDAPPASPDRPPATARGRALAAHVTALARLIGTRLEEHRHQNGAANCPVCGGPPTPARCGVAGCTICDPAVVGAP